MIIMIIFLVLSMVFLSGTVVYVNMKKKRNNKVKQIEIGTTEEKGKRKRKKQLSDVLNIKIIDNVICIGNRYSIVMELGSIDYHMLSEKEQQQKEIALTETAKAIDYPIQFFTTTEYIDTKKITNFMKQNNTSNERVQEYKSYLIDFLQNLMINRVVSVIKNYAIISYDGIYEDAIQELNREANSFGGNLLSNGIDCNVLNQNEVLSLLHKELNKNSYYDIEKLSKGGNNLYVSKRKKEKAN